MTISNLASLSLNYDNPGNVVSLSTDPVLSQASLSILSRSSDFVPARGSDWTDGIWIHELQTDSSSAYYNKLAITDDPALETNQSRSGLVLDAFLAGHTFFAEYSLLLKVSGFETGMFRFPKIKSASFTYTTIIPYSVSVSWNMNSGSGTIASQNVAYGDTITEPAVIPTRTSYRFLGWSSSASDTEAECFPYTVSPTVYAYSAGTRDTRDPVNTLVMYAVWVP